ncbi:MAG: M56 family metallopeptidase [Chloroflexi bacterium]|nr:MAG: M56 family metallopeptidase [Chloroflexota bacterium]
MPDRGAHAGLPARPRVPRRARGGRVRGAGVRRDERRGGRSSPDRRQARLDPLADEPDPGGRSPLGAAAGGAPHGAARNRPGLSASSPNVDSEGLVARLGEPELAAVLAHEAAHARRGDPLRLALASFVADLFFAVPLVARWRRSSVRRFELRADEAAARATSRGAVAGALLALDGEPSSVPEVTAARVSWLLGDQCREQRPPVRELGLSALGVVALAVSLLCVAEALLLFAGGHSPL